MRSGKEAEKIAAQYLEGLGFKILSQNWRTRVCEIDIVAKKSSQIYFVEVKYRLNSGQGTGLDYITPKKLKQMEFAANIWVSENSWPGDYCLAALEVSGDEYKITNFLTEL